MSGECEKCGEHALECTCGTFSRRRENGRQPCFEDGIDPPAELPERRIIHVNGRREHEAIIKDSAKCTELGIDQVYENIVYLNRWGGWLGE